MKKVYFVLTYSGTILGRIIRCKTGKMYTHVSIALDENLERMYSFSRLNPYNCFIGGFVHERINMGSFKRFKNTKAMVCYIEITDYQYEKLEKQIEMFEENRKMYKFNVLGLIYILFNKRIHRKNYFYCAEFIKYILGNANINIKLPDMPRPENFEKLKNSTIIYEGLLNRYRDTIILQEYEMAKIS